MGANDTVTPLFSPLQDRAVHIWAFDANGLMHTRHASINDVPIKEAQRLFFWDRASPRPAEHPSLSELGL